MLDPNALAGTLIENRYLLQKFLGNGAFGYVFAAEEMALGEVINEVAVKLIRPQNDKHRHDVLHEIRAMSRLAHPNLLGYRSAGEAMLGGQSLIFIASELAEGALEDGLQHGLMTTSSAAALTRDLAHALIYLAQRGVVHRDLKPANVLCVGQSWKVADFGLARGAAGSALHQTAAAGTLVYMSPEAIDGEIGAPVDIWALGVMLQQCLSGRFPYAPDSQLQFIRSVATREPFIAPGLPQPFDAIVRGCLTKDPHVRWTAQQVLDALGQKPLHSPASQNPVSLPVASPQAVAAPAANTARLPPQAHDLIVAAAGDGTHRTLSEALAAAPDNARIFVRPGIYRESVRLEKAVEIRGDGAREHIIIESAHGNCLRLEAGDAGGAALVSGLTLVGVAHGAGKKYFAVCVSRGALTLEDCIVASDSLACVAAQGESATLDLRGCRIVRGASDGVLFSDGAGGTLQDCEIAGHARHGLHIKKSAAPLARRCTLSANGGSGLHVAQDGRGTLQDCEIATNAKAGAYIAPGGAPTLRGCTIWDNKQQAVSAERGSAGTVENCDLRRNKFGAWDVASGSLMERRNNKE
jgi:hypothetical protein